MPYWHRYEDYRISYAGKAALGGGSVMTQIHEIDFVSTLFGFPSSIYAQGGKFSDLEIDVEDTVRALLSYTIDDKPLSVLIELDYHAFPGEKWIEIQTTKGRIFADFQARKVSWLGTETSDTQVWEFLDWERNQMFIDQTKHFFDLLSGTGRPEVSVKDALKTTELSLRIKEALQS